MILRMLVLCVGLSLAAVAGYVIVTVPSLTPPEAPRSPQWPTTITITTPAPTPYGRPEH